MKLKQCLLIILCVFMFGCDNSQESTEGGKRLNSVSEMTALQQMEIAFEGGYTVDQIKPVMNQALQTYGLPITEENYGRAASTLIVLRKQYGTKEMDILDYMIRSYVPGVAIQFPGAAAVSAGFLAAGDK